MFKYNFFIGYRIFRQGKATGQIAILIILFVAVAFLFVAVLLNLGKVSEKKMMLTIAAETAALNLASVMASTSAYLSGRYLAGSPAEFCNEYIEWWQIIGGYVIALVLMVTAPLATLPYILAAFGQSLKSTVQWMITAPQEIAAMNKYQQGLSDKEKMVESAIEPALLMSVTDDERIPDDGTSAFEDKADLDMDGMTTDYISRFQEWYRARLRQIKDASATLNSHITDFLCSPPVGTGLADFVAFIKSYTAGELTPCAFSYNAPLLSQMGYDDDLDCPEGGCSYIPNPDKSTGYFKSFYDINAVTDVSGATHPYTINSNIWKPGNLVCPTDLLVLCDPGPTYNDSVDFLKWNLMWFYDWAYGYTDSDGVWRPGALNTRINDLNTNFSTWFDSYLYNPPSDIPGYESQSYTYYYLTEKWLEWVDPSKAGSWTNPETPGGFADIKNRMIIERDSLIALADPIAAQITAKQAERDNLAGVIAAINGCLAQNCGLQPCPCRAILPRWQCALADLLGVACVAGTDYIPAAQARIAQLNSDIANLTNQLDAYQPRIILLNDLISQLTDMIDKFTEFSGKIKGFQDAVKQLAGERASLPAPPNPYNATYSWKDKNDYWHHVRVDVAVPCHNPNIDQYLKGNIFNRKKCAKLIYGSSWVGVRVMRFDQSQKQEMKFNVGQALWKFIFYNTAKGDYTGGDVESYTPSNAVFEHGYAASVCAKYHPNKPPELLPCPAQESFNRCHDDYFPLWP